MSDPKGIWRPIAEADKTKTYDLIISDGHDHRWRKTDCSYKRGGRIGKAGWYYVEDGQWEPKWCPVECVEGFLPTHFMEVLDFPT